MIKIESYSATARLMKIKLSAEFFMENIIRAFRIVLFRIKSFMLDEFSRFVHNSSPVASHSS